MKDSMEREHAGRGADPLEKKQRIGQMFDDIAPTYDLLNHLLSLGIDRGWRRRAVEMAARFLQGRSRTPLILDVATGTGDLAIALARSIPGAVVTGVDISENMLAAGGRKVAAKGLEERIVLQSGDAEALAFEDGSFDLVTVGFGVRNFGDTAAGLREMRRVLKPGGRCLIIEFSEPGRSLFALLYRFYFHRVLPLLGRLVSRDGAAYRYLPRSVDGFPPPPRFAEMLAEAGFGSVRIKKLTFGVAHIYEGVK